MEKLRPWEQEVKISSYTVLDMHIINYVLVVSSETKHSILSKDTTTWTQTVKL